jgi:hypothetical protein
MLQNPLTSHISSDVNSPNIFAKDLSQLAVASVDAAMAWVLDAYALVASWGMIEVRMSED